MAAGEDGILYDVFIRAEWSLEGEVLSKTGFDIGQLRGSLPRKFLTVAQYAFWWLLRGVQCRIGGNNQLHGLPTKLHRFINSSLGWKFALSCDGTLLAVLQNCFIEIRSVVDDFESVIAKCNVSKDSFPQWRKLAWSQDCSMLACSYSCGDVAVFDLAGDLLFSIPRTVRALPSDWSECICSLIFIEHKQCPKWSSELIVISYSGILKNYLVGVLPQGVYSVVYHPKYKLLLVGSVSCQNHNISSDSHMAVASQCGLTAWRVLSGHPFYNLMEDDKTQSLKVGPGIIKRLQSLSALNVASHGQDGVVHMALSPDGTKLAVVYLSGSLSLWQVPSLCQQNVWSVDQQPPHTSLDGHSLSTMDSLHSDIKEFNFGLVDANWWSEEALILAHSSGALTVSATKQQLVNLLGHSPEICEPWCHITAACDKAFLILECENETKSLHSKLLLNDSDDSETLAEKDGKQEVHEEDDEELSVVYRSKQFAKTVLFFLTESDRFQPPVKIRKVLHRTYRLVCLRSTTPEELYSRKIEQEEYGEALALAQTYGLDCDLVYQKQWRKSPVSVASIHDYLSKVKNRLWVLNECVERVPENYEAAKQLLCYGLQGTVSEVVSAVGQKKGPLPFLIPFKHNEHDDNEEEYTKQLKDTEDNLDFARFNLEQRDICMYRLKLLQYLDRLSTYEVILGGVHVAHVEYSGTFFEQFREINIVQAAVDYARDGNSAAVEAIFTYHSQKTLPHRLAILSNFDESLPPSEYQALLPEAGLSPDDPEIVEWNEKSWRQDDWVEKAECKNILGWNDTEDLADFIYQENPTLQQYRCKLSSQVVTRWYKSRASEIDSFSKQVSNSLELINLGLERGIQGLEDLHDDLVTLEVLVYETFLDVHLGLDCFQAMTDLEKLRMLLKKSTEDSFIGDLKCWVMPFLQRLGKRKKNPHLNLIHQYLTDVAKTDLTYVLKVFQNSTPEIKEPIIADIAQLIRLALDCIYITKRFDQLDMSFSILECLPASDEDVLSDQIRELNSKADQLEIYLCACETLTRHGVQKPVSFVLETQGNVEEAKELMLTLTRAASKRNPQLKEADWSNLLSDMLTLQKEVYTCIDPSVCYQIYVESLLHSGKKECIFLAGRMICKTALEDAYPEPSNPVIGPRIKCSHATELALKAAKEYFNSSSDLSDKVMDLARECLNLIEDRTPELQAEFDLMAALALLHEFGISILPLQVRLCEDKLGLIRQVLESTSSAYKKKQKILRLANLLQISGNDEKSRRGRVLMLVAESALQASDYKFAYETCQCLMEEDYASVWNICRIIGECEEFQDLKARQSLVAFSLTHCTPDELEPLLKTMSLLETKILYQELNNHMQASDQENGASSSHEGLLTRPKSLLSAVGDKKFWKNTMKWIRPLQDEQAAITDSPLITQSSQMLHATGFHPFYLSLVGKHVTRSKGDAFPYENIRLKHMADKPLLFTHCLLRTQKLSESRSEGTITEPTGEVMIQLAESVLSDDSSLGIAYLLALDKVEQVDEFFSNFGSSYLCFHMAAYCCALHTYNTLQPWLTSQSRADVYRFLPSDLIDHIMCHVAAGVHTDWKNESQPWVNSLIQYHNRMADFAQGQLLRSLGKGVDIGRFAQDPEYKRETILGLAMTIDEEVFITAMSLADRYEISKWEMLMTHLECLFSDDNLSTKEIQERVNKLQMMGTLLEDPAKVAERMQNNVYLTIDGTKHARLIYYYMVLVYCGEKDNNLKDQLAAETHLKTLKKLKPAAPSLDYKKLISDDFPLKVLQPVMTNANVHVLAKLANKIPTKDGIRIEPASVFKVFTEKLFWEGEQRSKQDEAEQQVDWRKRYDSCHKMLPRLSPKGIQELIDSVTFSESAVNNITAETRLTIVKRALKFARQQDAALVKKGESETQENSAPEEVNSTELIKHLEQSHRHLDSLSDPLIYELTEHDKEINTNYARAYDLSRSEPDRICKLASQMILGGVSLETVNELFLLAARQTPQNGRVGKALKETFEQVLGCLSQSAESCHLLLDRKDPMDVVKTIILTVSIHVQRGGTMANQEDIVECLKPFSANEAVSAAVKSDVLRAIEESFDLSGEDIFLFMFYQTDALVSSNWNQHLSPEDIDSDTKRHELFEMLLNKSLSLSQLLGLGTLLQIWPVLAATELNEEPSANPWVQLMDKLIRCHGDGEVVIKMLKQLNSTTSLTVECCCHVYNLMLLKCQSLHALKFAFVSKLEAMHHLALGNMKNLKVDSNSCDDELLDLVISRGLTAEIAQTPFLTPLVSYVLSPPDRPSDTTQQADKETRVHLVASQLQLAGYWAEAGTLLLKYHGTHPALSTYDNSLRVLSRWLRR